MFKKKKTLHARLLELIKNKSAPLVCPTALSWAEAKAWGGRRRQLFTPVFHMLGPSWNIISSPNCLAVSSHPSGTNGFPTLVLPHPPHLETHSFHSSIFLKGTSLVLGLFLGFLAPGKSWMCIGLSREGLKECGNLLHPRVVETSWSTSRQVQAAFFPSVKWELKKLFFPPYDSRKTKNHFI